MTSNVAAIVGSGTLPYTRSILPPSQRGSQAGSEGVRTGLQVMVGNPEDLNSVDAFAVSGVSLAGTPVRIWGPGINSLPRQREVTIKNQGPGSVYIGPNSTSVIVPSGFQINPPTANNTFTEITLPFLWNVDIWARADGAGASVTIIAY
jgi:hypothetical protein